MSKYADRNPRRLEPYFSFHMQAMTDEDLYEKGAIAAELAYRDQKIEQLQADLRQREAENKRLRLALKGYKVEPDECLDDLPCVSHMAYEQCEAENKRYKWLSEQVANGNFNQAEVIKAARDLVQQALENDNESTN